MEDVFDEEKQDGYHQGQDLWFSRVCLRMLFMCDPDGRMLNMEGEGGGGRREGRIHLGLTFQNTGLFRQVVQALCV